RLPVKNVAPTIWEKREGGGRRKAWHGLAVMRRCVQPARCFPGLDRREGGGGRRACEAGAMQMSVSEKKGRSLTQKRRPSHRRARRRHNTERDRREDQRKGRMRPARIFHYA